VSFGKIGVLLARTLPVNWRKISTARWQVPGAQMARARDEILRRLAYHRKALGAFAKMYDDGEPLAALGLAVSVYLIVHDPSKHDKSLLTQLGLKDKIQFIASAPPTRPGNLARDVPMVGQRMQRIGHEIVGSYIPFLGSGPYQHRPLQFSRWWKDEEIFRDGNAHMNRQKLVFTLRSQEGGTHLDKDQLNPYFEKMSKEGISTPIVAVSGQADQPLLNLEYAIMRQITWELLASLDRAQIT
jgi:hypothetical protein